MIEINPLEELEFLLEELAEQQKRVTSATSYQERILLDGKGLLLGLLEYPQFLDIENLIYTTVREMDRAIAALAKFDYVEALTIAHSALLAFSKSFATEACNKARNTVE